MASRKSMEPASAASPPPSPPPPAPEDTSLGARATALQNAFAKALEATLNKCSYENFAACFPTPAQYRPATLEMFHKDFTGRLSEVCKSEVENIMKERNVVALLNSLDRLISDAKARKTAAETNAAQGQEATQPVPPHTLPPNDLVNAHLVPFLTDARSSIQEQTTALEAKNQEIMQTIRAQRVEMQALVRGLEAQVADLERSAGMLQDDEGVQGLTADVQMVEEELKT